MAPLPPLFYRKARQKPNGQVLPDTPWPTHSYALANERGDARSTTPDESDYAVNKLIARAATITTTINESTVCAMLKTLKRCDNICVSLGPKDAL